MSVFTYNNPTFKFFNETLSFFINQDEYIVYGAYSLISIQEYNSSRDCKFSALSQSGFTYTTLWQYTFAFQSEVDFIYGLPYDGLRHLNKTNYEYVIIEYIKRTTLFKNLLLEILKLINSSINKTFEISKKLNPFEMTFNTLSNSDILQLQKIVDTFNAKYSFLNISLSKQNINQDEDSLTLVFDFIKQIAKNVKTESEIKRLMLFDVFEACDYAYKNRDMIEFHDSHIDIAKTFTKTNAVDELAKFFYPENHLESAKNQVYKLHREARARIFENELEQYFI